MLNVNDLFTAAQLTRVINVVPNSYGRLGQLGLFPEIGSPTRTIAIRRVNDTLTLLPSDAIAAPGTVNKTAQGDIKTFTIPRINHEGHVSTADAQAVLAAGGDVLTNMATLVNRALTTARRKHEITHEWHKVGAIHGNILDGDGTTVIYNLFTEFGITENTVDFVLGTATTDIKAKCMAVLRLIEDNLKGDIYSGVRALVDETFFDRLTSHATVKAAFANYQAAADRLGGDQRKGFTFGGITFEEYRGTATNSAGTASKFIPASTGRAFPEGTAETFNMNWGPADFNDAVNVLGQPFYVKTKPGMWDRGYDFLTQSNPLPLCYRPATLIKLFTSN